MPFKIKVSKFAYEPMAFYLHKKNDFFKRIKKHEKQREKIDDE